MWQEPISENQTFFGVFTKVSTSSFVVTLDEEYKKKLADYFDSTTDTVWKLQNFPKYVPRQSLTRFITRYELFKKVLSVQGSVIEVGVLAGGSLMSWAQLSSIMEYLNYQRLVVGFDAFGSLDAGLDFSHAVGLDGSLNCGLNGGHPGWWP